MTDAEIKIKVRQAIEIIEYCDDSSTSEKARCAWASYAGRLCQEIADEMERRIGKDAK